MMDLRNTAAKLFGSEAEAGEYDGPYVVRPGQLEILVRTPGSFEDAVVYADELMRGAAVMVSFNSVDMTTRNRIFDYLNGVSYIINASVSKISDKILIWTPEQVTVDKKEAKKSSWLG